ncbi:cyclic nucleotide-binding domain-containing protein [Pseudohalioglobus lutimaris]|uniref:Transcriptional regulator Crp n=1 Tax=Pseudohalioglobus lutimaris TaxID=1737061 RepID=A0A2N5X3B4_9GAMM|nr:cyclic nucleotide-binding domain-containing protein [Pseudohalioglobus lutimaris]PLW68967.1 transcriptional regulator Crp [Pseudohalioglobus lutimaris]
MLEKNNLLELLVDHCQQQHYPPRVQVLQPGDPADTLYYVVEGSLSIHREDEGGQVIVLAYLHQGDFLGEMGVFLDFPSRGVYVKTRAATVLAQITYQHLQALLETELAPHRADFLHLFGAQLAKRLMQSERKVGDLALLDVTGRIARVLLDLTEEPDAHVHPDGIRVKVTRTEMARLTGCSREMAGRCLRELEERELIFSEGRSVIVLGAGKSGAPLENV